MLMVRTERIFYEWEQETKYSISVKITETIVF